MRKKETKKKENKDEKIEKIKKVKVVKKKITLAERAKVFWDL